ncbi:MAG: hypothetical protein ACP6IS_04025 [Candidatus Asgardarchaeia archaeon]
MLPINPAPLFDELYVPPKLLYRDSELDLLQKLVINSVENELPLCSTISGIRGIGKTVFSNFFARNIASKFKPKLVYINTLYSSQTSILSLLASSLGLSETKSLTFSALSRFISKKVKRYVLIIFDKVSFNNINEILKIRYNLSSRKLITLTILNYDDFLKLKYFDKQLTNDNDIQIVLNAYNEFQLLDITKQRVLLVFPYFLDNELIEFITDIVSEYDFSRPATVMEFLRMLYPLVLTKKHINANIIRKICNEIGLLDTDYVFLAEKINELNRLTKNFIKYFFSKMSMEHTVSPYIHYKDILTTFKEFFEANDIELTFDIYNKIFHTMVESGLLVPSKIHHQTYYTVHIYDDLLSVIM